MISRFPQIRRTTFGSYPATQCKHWALVNHTLWIEEESIELSLRRRESGKQASETQKRQFPDADVIEFVEGDGKNFDYGLDLTLCSKCDFYSDQGAEEMPP